MHWLSRLTLLSASLGFLGFGLWFLVDPIAPMAAIGIGFSGEGAGIELRAFYGGLELGLAAWLAAAAFRSAWVAPGLWLVLGINLGIFLGRLLGIALDGEWIGFFAGALVWEGGFTALAGTALWLERRRMISAR